MRKLYVLLFLFLFVSVSFAQKSINDSLKIIDYNRPQDYVIAEIKVTGVKYLNPNHLITISGMHVGQKITIPGSDISNAIKKYWKHGLFSDVRIIITKVEGTSVNLEIQLEEQPRLNDLTIVGINKSERTDIEEKINLKKGTQITDNILNNTETIIKRHFVEKGFLNTEVKFKQEADTGGTNRVNLSILIQKKDKVKIEEIVFEGNRAYEAKKLRRVLKKTKQRDLNIFKGSKYILADYKEDKIKLIDFYNEHGYRDAKILKEELYPINEERIGIKLVINEGNVYYIRKITWVGNTKYPSEILTRVLGIKPKDVYDKKLLENRLNTDEDAVSTLYMDEGHLFFSVTPVEANIDNDSVDLELRIYEGDPATINNVIIKGNTKTNEHVVRRELYTRPGELFSKTDLMRSYRQVATLGHFNPENIGVNPIPNQADGTVDIEYTLEERANDQLELSGGWGGYYGFVGSIGVKFTNLSAGRLFDPKAWRPVPTGDGQTLSLRAQSNLQYHGFNVSFIEPWLGGKKPTSLSVSMNYTMMKDVNSNKEVTGSFKIIGGSVGIGKRLKFPDDYFSVYSEISYNQYILNDYRRFALTNGNYNLLSVKGVISRSSQDQMIYPRKGSAISLSLQLTPPYSLINGIDYKKVTDSYEKYKNVEFHKWMFDAAWYTELTKNLVLAIKSEFGVLGYYNPDIGYPIFEKFTMGGSGLSGYNMYGSDVIPLRGYDEDWLTPYTYRYNPNKEPTSDGNIFVRYYSELRYPITLNPSATLYGLAFVEGGNLWSQKDDFNPFSIKRSAGVGIRAFLPMFGLLGFDWGYGFDPIYDQNGKVSHAPRGQFHFILGQQL